MKVTLISVIDHFMQKIENCAICKQWFVKRVFNCKSHISDNDYLTLIGLRGQWDPHGGVCFGYFLSEVFEALWRRDFHEAV